MVASTRIEIRYCRLRGDRFSFEPPVEIKAARGNFDPSAPSSITYESDAVVCRIGPHSGKTFLPDQLTKTAGYITAMFSGVARFNANVYNNVLDYGR